MNQKNLLHTVSIRPVEEKDLFNLWQLIYGTPNPEWKKWDAPYFPLTPISFEEFSEKNYLFSYNLTNYPQIGS